MKKVEEAAATTAAEIVTILSGLEIEADEANKAVAAVMEG